MYRFLSEVSQPFTLVLLLTVLAFIVLWLTRRIALRHALPTALGLLLLWALSTPIVAELAMASLESHHPPFVASGVPPDALVVLSGSVGMPFHGTPELGESSIVRTLCAAKLYHAVGPLLVIATRGISRESDLPAPARLMAELLRFLDVSETDILVEDQSRTTFESARATARLLRKRGLRRVALVTEASHLHRSVMSFRGQGIEVIPAGCNYQSRARSREDVLRFVPNAGAASTVRGATHEWIGIAWYWLTGKL